MNLRKSSHLEDWYVIDCPDGVAQPEGSREECLSVVAAVKSGKTYRGGKRIAVTVYPDGHAKFYSPRNCDGSPEDMVRIEAREIPAWCERAESVLANTKDQPRG